MLIAACPGGPTSNLITFVARGDTALSITLTALSSAVIVDQRQVLVDHFRALSGVTAALDLTTMGVGFLATRVFALNPRQQVTIAIEAGIQNGTLATVIAMSIVGVSEMAIPAGVYSLLMFVSGGALMGYFGAVRAPGETPGR